MPLVRTVELIAEARAAGRGVAAFNAVTLEHAEAIALGAERAGLPAIVQVSHNTLAFHGMAPERITAPAVAVARTSTARLSLHLDHAVNADELAVASSVGFSSIMADTGGLPYDQCLGVARSAAVYGEDFDLWVEAELGFVGGKPDAPQDAHAAGVRTDPDEAFDFVASTGIDGLAVAVGSSHAMTTRTAELDLDLIARLREAAGVPLVLHGSSGVADGMLRDAVRAGITKVNIGTALNIAYTDAVREHLPAVGGSPDPRRYLTPAREAMAATVAHLLEVVAG